MDDEINGIAFPFRISTGGVAMESGPEKLKANLEQLLSTAIGERVMRRDYGGGLRQLLYDPNNDVLRAVVQHQIAKTVGQWEPRVEIQDLRVTQHDSELYIELLYLIRRTQQRQSLSVPVGLGGL